ncbi:MAG: hypothetical protein J7L53_10605 [Deltaproteobacteria bacterium]|nr:hypothetical protein [Deltaproteobacteria bacterium]
MKDIRWFGFIIILIMIITGCSSSSDSSPQVINRPGAEAMEVLGTFPVGPDYINYEEPTINIASPEPGYVTKEDYIEVTGAVKKGTADIKGLYVNGKEIPIDKDGGDFSATIPINNSDDMFFPIIVMAVDSEGFVSGARTVIIKGDANPLGELIDNAVYLNGNEDFISNAMRIVLSTLDGQNLAAWLDTISRDEIDLPEWLKNFLLGHDATSISPRAVMLQGIELYKKEDNPDGYQVIKIGDDNYDIITDLKIKKMIAEYTINGDPSLQEGKNFINTQIKDIIIEGIRVNLKVEDTELYIRVYVNSDVELSKGDNSETELDTPYLDIWNILLDFLEYILEQLLGIDLGDLSIPWGININILDLLMGGEEGDIYAGSLTGFNYLYMDSTSLELSADAGFDINEGLVATYATPENNPSKPDLSNDITNSTFALSDDFINQALAVFFSNEDISHMEDTITIEGFPKDFWLADENGNMEIGLVIDVKTPPVLELDEDSDIIGVLRLRDIYIEASITPKDMIEPLTVLKLSVDTDLEMKWDAQTQGFTFKLARYPRYLIMFNRLYPLVFPEEISQIPDIIADLLNQLCEKVGLLGVDIKDIKTPSPGYMTLYTDITSDRDISKMKQTSFEEAINSEEWACEWTSMGTEFSPGVATSIIGNEIAFSTPEDGSALSWNDSVMFEFTAPEGHVITGISFDPELLYYYIGNDLDYYEEFAILCITRDGIDDENKDGIVPVPGIAVPYEIEAEDISELEGQPVELQVPPCRHIGIGLRLRRKPLYIGFPIYKYTKVDASATGITVYTADMSIDTGLD